MFAEVCAESGEGENQFVKWETYLFFVLFVGFNFGMEYWRQKALNLFSTMYCVPLFQVSLVIFSVSYPDLQNCLSHAHSIPNSTLTPDCKLCPGVQAVWTLS